MQTTESQNIWDKSLQIYYTSDKSATENDDAVTTVSVLHSETY
jgi:hypothetical protein